MFEAFTLLSCVQVLLGRSDVSGWGAFLKVIYKADVVVCSFLFLLLNFFLRPSRIVWANMNTLVSTLGS